MFVPWMVRPFIRQRLPADNIHQVITTRRNDLRRPKLACISQSIRSCGNVGTVHIVTQFLSAEIEHARKSTLSCKAFKRATTHASGVEHGHLKSTRL